MATSSSQSSSASVSRACSRVRKAGRRAQVALRSRTQPVDAGERRGRGDPVGLATDAEGGQRAPAAHVVGEEPSGFFDRAVREHGLELGAHEVAHRRRPQQRLHGACVALVEPVRARNAVQGGWIDAEQVGEPLPVAA